MSGCGEVFGQIRGILYYEQNTGNPPVDKTDVVSETQCEDESRTDLVSYIIKEVPWPWPTIKNASQFGELKTNGIYASRLYDANFIKRTGVSMMRWQLNNSTMSAKWGEPTLQRFFPNGTTDLGNLSNAVILPSNIEWFYLLVVNAQKPDLEKNQAPAIHPMHLHGHDYFILSQGDGLWNGTVNTLNPPRRDTATLTSGHLLLAWKIGNPGVWLFHCHLGWHTEMGFDLQFIDHPESIPNITNHTALEEDCQLWRLKAKSLGIQQKLNDAGV